MLKTGQAMETQIQNRLRLSGRQTVLAVMQTEARLQFVGTAGLGTGTLIERL